MDLKSKRFWISIFALLSISGLAFFLPDGGATVSAINTTGLIIGIYVGGESGRHIVKENRQKKFDV